jgi:hypothetical protein
MPDRNLEAPVLANIEHLVDEERALRNHPSLDAAERQRLDAVEVELDQCWDLLRQRRALRETGRSPAEAQVRPPEVVEKYEGCPLTLQAEGRFAPTQKLSMPIDFTSSPSIAT